MPAETLIARAAIRGVICCALITVNGPTSASVPPPESSPPDSAHCADPTTAAQLEAWVRRLDPDARRDGNAWEIAQGGRTVLLVFDEAAGRMRLMTAVAVSQTLGESVVRRALQANFDTALDARYAIAHGWVWSVFIHPLPTLDETEFTSGLRQVVSAAENFGTTYSSGELLFQGGDTASPAPAPSDSGPEIREESL